LDSYLSDDFFGEAVAAAAWTFFTRFLVSYTVFSGAGRSDELK